ncbi:sodium:solute symporter [Ectothiorhodospiraceae bacterium WFHF3C12]|nr:sodium:solute symporter [Ectothiorhodospiraceae bacterium WFHF3C12]
MTDWTVAAAFWGFLLLYGGVMYVVSPRAASLQTFFQGTDAAGRPVTEWWLTASIFISWIFAKSVTNAANLGASYGAVGSLAYAAYWLSIPVAGLVIYGIRRHTGAGSLVDFLISRYGRGAAAAFAVAIMIRLYNEVWSNTAVVGGYFGEPGSWPFIAAAVVFTLVTLGYSAKGGLRGSIVTDALQAVIFVFFLATVLFLVLPEHGVANLVTAGSWQLSTGVDLLLVAGLQIFSYPFHDPVLTDRAFINEERRMLRSFVVAGVLGFICIFLFGLFGVHAQLSGIEGEGNVPAAVGRSLGVATFFFMSVIMMSSAGSTLDSTFSSLSKTLAFDLPAIRSRQGHSSIRFGIAVMVVFAVLGNLPMVLGTDILKATTISGTMVMGLAPVFLFYRWAGRTALGFHLSFWTGVVLGVALAAGLVPDSWAIGEGRYAGLLGVNLYGLLLCTALFWLPSVLGGRRLSGAH